MHQCFDINKTHCFDIYPLHLSQQHWFTASNIPLQVIVNTE